VLEIMRDPDLRYPGKEYPYPPHPGPGTRLLPVGANGSGGYLFNHGDRRGAGRLGTGSAILTSTSSPKSRGRFQPCSSASSRGLTARLRHGGSPLRTTRCDPAVRTGATRHGGGVRANDWPT
jgi:hypothetical protein